MVGSEDAPARFGCHRRRRWRRNDNGDLMTNQIGCQSGQTIQSILRPAVFNGQVAALEVAGFGQTAMKRRDIPCRFERPGVEKPNHRHRPLLRPRRERPCRCAADLCNEIAPPISALVGAPYRDLG